VQRSSDHILTSHVGSLPRPKNLDALLLGEPVDIAAYVGALPDAVRETVRHQIDIGLDIINDGECSKMGSWSGYVKSRLGGYEMKPLHRTVGPEQRDFPEYYSRRPQGPTVGGAAPLQMVCTGPISYIGQEEIARDVANLQQATSGVSMTDAFMCSISPENVNYQPGSNEYYSNEEEYILANAAALQHEYRAITDGGFILQIDMPVQKYNLLSLTVEEFRSRYAQLVEIVNEALQGIPRERVRVHICYGGGKQPHTGDLNLPQFIDLALKLNVGAISYDQNVRHDHEWRVFENVKLPDGIALMPGVCAHTTDVVEHPELIAERLVRLAKLVGRENVIAGTDCGLGGRVPDEVAWAKFASMVSGAALATKELFGSRED
jgi:5-methyltetrahydropteroyltriglutamate--homocysteine methyltransferase